MSGDTAAATIGVQPIAELFTAPTTALWATTYNLDIALVSEFLLSRLGDPPLNVTVLADHHQLTTSLDRIPAERVATLATVNRRWLLRGVRAGTAFHPKTYLQVTPGRVKLVVGSGNLNTGGLDRGREVFTVFRSNTPAGDTAIASWRTWMRHLVGRIGDATLADRFRDLEERLPAAALGVATGSPLLHNLDTPIAEQLRERLPADEVDELWLTAPFFDRDAVAVGALLESFRPARVRLFVTSWSSVHGPALVARLRGSGAEVTVAAYIPDKFVHAKLVGIVVGGEALLLSGSANLSRAALTTTPSSGGNVEMAVLAPIAVDELRALFIPPGWGVEERSLVSLSRLGFRSYHADLPTPPVRLLSAVAVADGRVQIATESDPDSGWRLDDLVSTYPLTLLPDRRPITATPVAGRLVQVVDDAGAVLSNRVVVDDPAALTSALTAATAGAGADRPGELAAGDLDSPLAQALVWLHRNLVMDVSERAGSLPSGGVTAEEATSQDDDLWDRLEREQLARDPRSATYDRLWDHDSTDGGGPFIELLDAMRRRVGVEASNSGEVAPGVDGRHPSRDAERAGQLHRWSLSARVRVRARNVLRRWAAAQTDPRLVWVDPLAPAGNFVMIADLFWSLRLSRTTDPASVELDEADLDDLWLRWLRPFVGTGEADGWLDRLDAGERSTAVKRMPEGVRAKVAALCWLLARPGAGQRERVVGCQRVVEAALQQGFLEPSAETATYLAAVTGKPVTRDSVDSTLLAAIAFVDDRLWCDRVSKELEVHDLSLEDVSSGGTPRVRIHVGGIADPLLDTRVPRLVAGIRRYRRCNDVALFSTDHEWRLSVHTGDKIAYLGSAGNLTESVLSMQDGTLEAIARDGGVLSNLFVRRLQAVG